MKTNNVLMTVTQLESVGSTARSAGDEPGAESSFREGLGLLDQMLPSVEADPELLLDVLHCKVRLALNCGDVAAAKRGLQGALESDPALAQSEKWRSFYEITAWTDEWLIAAVRQENPDAAALDVLADRYWKEVFGRCYLLTLNHEKASDLAQQAWVRVLRTRERLLPGGNFPAYVSTIATNLWRDAQRWSRRAGPMADQNLVSLDQPIWADNDDTIFLADALPDLNSPDTQTRALLRLDIDQALGMLAPKLRDVVIARFITGESSAEIAKRYGRTEQAISGWIRGAVRDMRAHLEDAAVST